MATNTEHTTPSRLTWCGTTAELATTRTPSITRFPNYDDHSTVVGLTHDTLNRLTEDEL